MCLCVISFTVYVILLSLFANYAKFPLFTRHFVNTNKEFMLCTNIPLNILDGYDDVFDIAMDFSFIKYKCTKLSGRLLDPILATFSCF